MKRLMVMFVLFLFVLNLMSVSAQEEPEVTTETSCTGFWGKIKCFFVGDATNRAGRSWFDRNLAGEATLPYPACSIGSITDQGLCYRIGKLYYFKPDTQTPGYYYPIVDYKDGQAKYNDKMKIPMGQTPLPEQEGLTVSEYTLKQKEAQQAAATKPAAGGTTIPSGDSSGSIKITAPTQKTFKVTYKIPNADAQTQTVYANSPEEAQQKIKLGFTGIAIGGQVTKVEEVPSPSATAVALPPSPTPTAPSAQDVVGIPGSPTSTGSTTPPPAASQPSPASTTAQPSAVPPSTSTPLVAPTAPSPPTFQYAISDLQKVTLLNSIKLSPLEINTLQEKGELTKDGTTYKVTSEKNILIKKGDAATVVNAQGQQKVLGSGQPLIPPAAAGTPPAAAAGTPSTTIPPGTPPLAAPIPPPQPASLTPVQEAVLKKMGLNNDQLSEIKSGKTVSLNNQDYQIKDGKITYTVPTGSNVVTSGVITPNQDGSYKTVETTTRQEGTTLIPTIKTSFNAKDGTLQLTQTETTTDGKKSLAVTIAGTDYKPTSDYDPVTGECKSGTTRCLEATTGDFASRFHVEAKNNPTGINTPAFVAVISQNNKVTENYQFTYKDEQGEHSATYTRNCAGKECTPKTIQTDSLKVDGFTPYNTNYGKGGINDDDKREYNTQTIGVFQYIDSGVGWGNCQGTSCKNQAFFSSDGKYVCSAAPCTEKTQDKVEFSNSQALNSFCQNKDDCLQNIQQSHSSQQWGRFFAGQTGPQQVVRGIADASQGWSGISHALLGDLYAHELATTIDRWFAGSVLSQDYWESKVCYAPPADLNDEGSAFVETLGGDFQTVAMIQAEMVQERTPLLCLKIKEKDGEEKQVCPKGLICKDQFCYDEKNPAKPVEAFFYKITWGVTAPSDRKFTPYQDEASAVEFNVIIDPQQEKLSLYDEPITLQNGQHAGDKIAHYSHKNYAGKEICIIWRKAPTTLVRSGVFEGTTPVKNVCFTLIFSQRGSVEYNQQTAGSSISATPSGEIQRNGNW